MPDSRRPGSAIRAGGATDSQTFALEAFVEKPDLKTAESYVGSGDYFWNSGIFSATCQPLVGVDRAISA